MRRATKNLLAARLRRRKRVRANIQGTKERPRLAIFRSVQHISAQVIDDQSRTTLIAAHDREVQSGKTPMERARAVGALIAEKTKTVGVTRVVFDRRGYQYHGRVQALAEGARAGGLVF